MKLYEKIIDGKQHCKPANKIVIIKDGMQTINPTEEMLLEDGWVEHIPVQYEPTEEEILNREKEYKIDEILIHERNRRPEYKCIYDEDVEYDYEGDYPVLYELESKESNVMNESYTNWRTQQKKICSADQEEYLKESLSILFESLFDTDKWQYYGNF